MNSKTLAAILASYALVLITSIPATTAMSIPSNGVIDDSFFVDPKLKTINIPDIPKLTIKKVVKGSKDAFIAKGKYENQDAYVKCVLNGNLALSNKVAFDRLITKKTLGEQLGKQWIATPLAAKSFPTRYCSVYADAGETTLDIFLVNLPWKARLPILYIAAKKIMEGLSFLHSINLSHNNVKPENIVIDAETDKANPSVAFIDFDSVMDLTNLNQNTAALSQELRKVGTEGFIAPEVIGGKALNPQLADEWSAGATIYTLVAKEMLRIIDYTEQRTHAMEFLQYNKAALSNTKNLQKLAQENNSVARWKFIDIQFIPDATSITQTAYVFDVMIQLIDPNPVARPTLDQLLGKTQKNRLSGIQNQQFSNTLASLKSLSRMYQVPDTRASL
ncbi:kinase-like domain-containing protein [Syncephalis fuscata]|nr:kinase-like domain-containing protein [Syncephalis fuscata]